LQNGAALVQYRHKTAGAGNGAPASALLALCRQYEVPLIINDHVDLCLEIDADGIHVGGTDASIAEVRRPWARSASSAPRATVRWSWPMRPIAMAPAMWPSAASIRRGEKI
jgi:hypothetical protein